MDMITGSLLAIALIAWLWAGLVSHRNKAVNQVTAYLANHPDIWFTMEQIQRRTHVNPSTLDLVLDQLEEWRIIEQCVDGPEYKWKYRTEHM